VVAGDIGRGGSEAGRAQPMGQVVGLDWVEGVPSVAGADHLEIERLLADEDATWPQDPLKLGE